MNTSQRGIDFIKGWEQFSSTPYQKKGDVPTIGYGHTRGVKMSDAPIDEGMAELLLKQDVLEAEKAVSELVKVKLTQQQYDALVSWTFNLGQGNLGQSTLLKKINAGEHALVPQEMTKWVYADGKPSKGLARRRVKEAELYLT